MKKLLCFILVGLISITLVGCGNDIKQKNVQDTKEIETEEKTKEQKILDFDEYVDMAFSSGLLYNEFSKGNYPDEGIDLLALVDAGKLKRFTSDFYSCEWNYYNADEFEKDIMSKLDISSEEIRETTSYREEINAYLLPPGGVGVAGIWTKIAEVDEKPDRYEIHYELWGVDQQDSENREELEYTGILTVSKDGKMISNWDINYVNKFYERLREQTEDFYDYYKYFDITDIAGLLDKEFSRGNYPKENIHLLNVVDFHNLESFTGTYNGEDCTLYKEEYVEKDIKRLFDITSEEIREREEHLKDQCAYRSYFVENGLGLFTIINEVKEKDDILEIYYGSWFENELAFTGKLTVSKDQKILSNSDINFVNKSYAKSTEDTKDFSEYEKYIDIVSDAGLIYREFSKNNYPTENLHLLYVVDNEKLDEFECTFDNSNWILHKAEDVEENLKEKFDITTEELRTKLEYIQDKNAYPKYQNGGGGVGSWTIIKDVIEKEETIEIYYECWFMDYNPIIEAEEEKLDFEGKLTVTKDGKILSNSDINFVNKSYAKSTEEEFSEYEKYIDIVTGVGLLDREFSKGNYPTENLYLLHVVEDEILAEFEGTYKGKEWSLYKAEDVEENLMEKFDITTEELRTKLEYLKDQNAYRSYGDGGAGCWTIIKDVIEKDDTFEIYYECWVMDADPTTPENDKKLDFEGKLTVSKDGKILSNSDIKHY